MSGSPPYPIDPGLLERFRRAAQTIQWRPATLPRRAGGRRSGGSRSTARIARLHEEEARVEREEGRRGRELRVDSGPVGVLVLLVEIAGSEELPSLTTLASGADPEFPNGAVLARWPPPAGTPSTVGVRDLIEVARYALP